MKQHVRRIIRAVPFARAANDVRTRRDLKIIEALPHFAPNSAGYAEVRSVMALKSATRSTAFMAQLADQLDARGMRVTDPHGFAERPDAELLRRLDELLRHYGSDKSVDHDYHIVYATILASLPAGAGVLEVGIGTNNETVLSTMGPHGRPGASLRTFRDLLPTSSVHGADVDRGILFSEERIATHWVDQTSDASVRALEAQLPDDLHLVIDDGLHTPDANLQILMLGLRTLPVGGWLVIEDVIPAAEDFWRVVTALLPDRWDATLVRAKGGDMYVVRRTA